MGTITVSTTGIICAPSALARFVDRSATMDEDALENVFSYVERAYVRMQAGDVITQCLDEGRLTPLQSLVEMLIVVGP
jgi:hypothetical protein